MNNGWQKSFIAILFWPKRKSEKLEVKITLQYPAEDSEVLLLESSLISP
jgi:hypothetical protein